MVVDLSERDGFKRLVEIRRAIEDGTFENWLELVFLPLYGKESGPLRVELAESTIRLQAELYHADKISSRLLAATLIMANKMIGRDRLKEIWKEIKMLDILEIAHEEGKDIGLKEGKDIGLKEGKDIGLKEGKDIGLKEGKDIGREEGEVLGLTKGTREMLKDLVMEKYDAIPKLVFEKIDGIDEIDILKTLFRKALKCDTIEKFEKILAIY